MELGRQAGRQRETAVCTGMVSSTALVQRNMSQQEEVASSPEHERSTRAYGISATTT